MDSITTFGARNTANTETRAPIRQHLLGVLEIAVLEMIEAPLPILLGIAVLAILLYAGAAY